MAIAVNAILLDASSGPTHADPPQRKQFTGISPYLIIGAQLSLPASDEQDRLIT
jgi:hypothetical protein